MELTQQLLTRNDCYQAGRTIAPQGVMVHSTGVAQPDVNVFLRTWNVPDYPACVHAFVHKGGVTQTLPWTCRGWHAGTGTSGRSANNTHLSFEMCEPAGHTYNGGTMVGYDPAKNAAYFAAMYQNAVALCAMLCKTYDLDPLADGVLICHSEGYARGIASNHADVMQWFPKHGKSMDTLRADVARALEEEQQMTQEEIIALVGQTLAQWRQTHVYHTVEELPDWGKPAIVRLISEGALQGDETGSLNLSEELLRALVVIDRLTQS